MTGSEFIFFGFVHGRFLHRISEWRPDPAAPVLSGGAPRRLLPGVGYAGPHKAGQHRGFCCQHPATGAAVDQSHRRQPIQQVRGRGRWPTLGTAGDVHNASCGIQKRRRDLAPDGPRSPANSGQDHNGSPVRQWSADPRTLIGDNIAINLPRTRFCYPEIYPSGGHLVAKPPPICWQPPPLAIDCKQAPSSERVR